jgi:hypothetical protein
MEFEVDRSDLHRTRVLDDPALPLSEAGVRLRIDSFALTSNNITYAVFGEAMQYWNFFSAAGSWGRVPVWGFGEVVESRMPEVVLGRRVYGYFPMATELVVTAGRADERGFHDVAVHRRPMAGAYNRYVFTDTDPIHEPGREAQQMLLWPLFFTSFLIDDFLADNECFGADTVVISSASSKTAIGAAFMLAARDGVRVVGLTSEGNAPFVRGLGCYDDVVSYPEIGSLAGTDAVYVDIAGNLDVRSAVHTRFAERLLYSMVVGGTHWDHESAAPAPTVGARPEFFFAPTQIAKRTNEWGQTVLDERVGDAWHRYSAWVDEWLVVEECNGPDRVEVAYRNLLEGRVDPRIGYVCSMRTGAAER